MRRAQALRRSQLRSALSSLLEAVDASTAKSFFQARDLVLSGVQQSLAAALRSVWQQQYQKLNLQMSSANATQGYHVEADDPNAASEWMRAFDQAIVDSLEVFASALTDAAWQAVEAGAKHLLAEIDTTVSFNLDDPLAVEWLKDYGAERVAWLNDTTRQRLQSVLEQARAEGYSYDKTATLVRQLFSGFSTPSPLGHIKDRAELVAVTESGTAYEEGRWMAVQKTLAIGIEMEKSWLADPTACEGVCRPNAEVGWISTGDKFPQAGDRAPGHPGCRCGTLYRRKSAPQQTEVD